MRVRWNLTVNFGREESNVVFVVQKCGTKKIDLVSFVLSSDWIPHLSSLMLRSREISTSGFASFWPSSSSSFGYHLARVCVKGSTAIKVPCCSLTLDSQEVQSQANCKHEPAVIGAGEYRKGPEEGPEPPEDGVDGISGIHVPRQRYIAISKSELLDAIVDMFESQEDKDQFRLLSSCLDSILHAEHKSILEEMRFDYTLTQSMEKKGINCNNSACSDGEELNSGNESDFDLGNGIKIGSMEKISKYKNEPRMDLRSLFGSSTKKIENDSPKESRVAVATRFQRAFVELLYNAQFEELSARDLMLTSALNSDSLLTLPIYVDWKKASESNAIIFRRGYALEKQKGLLLVEKLDYLQSKLLQGIFFIVSKPLGEVGIWITKAFMDPSEGQDPQVWTERVKHWLKELPFFQKSYSYSEGTSDNLLEVGYLPDKNLPIWLAAQRAVTRYEGILSPVGPRGRLLRKLLMWTGLIPSTPKIPFNLESDVTISEPYLRPIFLSRITLSDIWEPATRKSSQNDFWKMLKTAISIIFSQSILQEPAFQELILLFTKGSGDRDTEDTAEIPSLQLKIYEKISIPDLPVIFPHKKLSFRILDTVRLDVATILGLLAYFINYKFEDILSSPSAVLLDVIGISALIIYLTRVALGYKQTWDRYQLLVNKTLHEKTLASGFGSVHFLLDASEQQQYKEAILVYAILLKAEIGEVTCPKNVKDKCERFMYNTFKEQVEMPVDKAMQTLLRLGLVTERVVDQKLRLQPIPCTEAFHVLKQRWNGLLHKQPYGP
ncbi:uncharacterized protein LOC127810025 [Diospyros lotus]|uniref:uncharacterized protein LOC127810025 n=1 Tax=Diospyros lotus TaxID=55363 RepID=UPI00225A0DC2|nr:uncharacterized protein LOC127810025 [Diospyros lotus]